MYAGKEVRIIAAVAANGTIGRRGRLPWSSKDYPGELAHFKDRTSEQGANTVVMGRATWDSIDERYRPLEGRANIVISRSRRINAPGVHTARSLEDALEQARTHVWLIGGAPVYGEALSKGYVDTIVLSELKDSHPGDRSFPPIPTAFEAVDEDRREGFTIVTYRRDPKWNRI